MKALQKNVIFNRVGFDKIGNFEYEKIMVLEAAGLFVRPSGMSFEAFRRAAAQSKYSAPLGRRGARWALAPRFAFACCALSLIGMNQDSRTHTEMMFLFSALILSPMVWTMELLHNSWL